MDWSQSTSSLPLEWSNQYKGDSGNAKQSVNLVDTLLIRKIANSKLDLWVDSWPSRRHNCCHCKAGMDIPLKPTEGTNSILDWMSPIDHEMKRGTNLDRCGRVLPLAVVVVVPTESQERLDCL